MTAGLVVAVLAGAVAFIALQRATTEQAGVEVGAGPQVSVVVATQAIALRSQLTAQDLELKDFPVGSVPEGAVAELDEAVGKLTLVDLAAGEIILANRLLDPNVITGDGRLALFIAEDEVLMAFPAADLMSRSGVLKPGDHVDLLFSHSFSAGGEEGSSLVTFDLLENVTVAALVGEAGKPPSAFLFTLAPQDALILKHMKDAGGIVDVVLRAPGTEYPFDTEPVDADYVILRYRIPTPR
ncbi:Flp pilus assembly protein CpaB [Chloroflexota bacterium]